MKAQYLIWFPFHILICELLGLSKNITMDEINQKIIKILQKNARTPNSEIAKQLGYDTISNYMPNNSDFGNRLQWQK